MQSEHFIFNGVKSSDMDQYIVRMDSGGVQSPFFGGQDIEEEYVGSRITPYHFGTTKRPIEFTVQISPLDKEWTPQRKSEIGRWLIHDTYKEFQTADDMGKYYYAIVIEAPNFELYSNKGFIPITFRTSSPYAWSPVYVDSFDISMMSGNVIELSNLSNINVNYKPTIEIEFSGKEGELSATLRNLSNGGKEFKLTKRYKSEVVSIDNENEEMVSNRQLSNPFSGFNGDWFELVYGINRIEVLGDVKRVRTKMRFPIIQ